MPYPNKHSADVHKASVRIVGAVGNNESVDYGYKWRVRVVEFGTDVNGTHWTKEPLVAALPKFEGAKVFMLSEAQHQRGDHPFGKPPTEIVGWLSNAEHDEKGILADLNILKTAHHLRDALVDAWERGNKELFGVSLDLSGRAKEKKIDGKTVSKLEEVNRVTLDVVYDPAAGGKFLRMAAARQAGQKKEEAPMWKKLLASLKSARPDMKEKIEAIEAKGDAATEEEMSNLIASAMAIDTGSLEGKLLAAMKEEIARIDKGGDAATLDEAKKMLAQARIVACGVVLERELGSSGLPEFSRKRLAKQFADEEFTHEILCAAVKEEKEYVDTLTGSGGINGAGGIRMGEADHEKRIKMLDDFFERKVHSFKAAYVNLTGDERVTGELKAATRLRASIDSTSFAEILGDSLTRRMVKEYNSAGMDDWKRIAEVVPVSDFRTNRRPRMGGYGDLPIVPQGNAYPALTSPGDEEATYAAAKRGGTEDITLEAIKNDDVGMIRRIPQKLARTAARTLHKFVFDFLATNPTIYDATALFTAGHGNLATTALSSTSLTARRQAMLKQTEINSGEVLGIPPKYLVVPIDLDKTAYDLTAAPRNSDFDPTSADFTRTLQMELIVVPYWTDANNWYLVANPLDIPTIEIGFLDGTEDPYLVIQNQPDVGSVFSNDKLTYKIRHIYGGAVIDYRGMDGSIVP